jgi:hypothetical protein
VRYFYWITIFHLFFAFSQEVKSQSQIRGLVVDSLKSSALPYANIIVKHKTKGTISNETGYFSLKSEGLKATDTISFQYVGYKTRELILADLDSFNYINLKEEIFNLAETFVFANSPDAKAIVEQILEHKEQNYKKINTKNQVFVRSRELSDITNFDIRLKRNSFPELNKRLLNVFEKHMPKESVSYTDFLGYAYQSEKHEDSLKLNPIKTVALKEKEISELEELSAVFEKMLNNTNEKEYWKVKTGVLSQKVQIDNDTTDIDSLDAELKNTRKLKYFSRSLEQDLSFSNFESEKQWDFLHNTNRYIYTIVGGTRVNGEDAYIIEFEPKNSGKYKGKMYVAIASFALIRADYVFAENKQGMHFQMFGIGYTVNAFSGSIYFEKQDGIYALKYFSKKLGTSFSFDRPISLLKKRKRFLIDKELFEIKVKFEIDIQSESSVEYLVLDRQIIPDSEYQNFEPPKRMKMIYVDQFDDKLWKDYPIIEPTKQMRVYKKME